MSFPWDVMTEANDLVRIHPHERALNACMHECTACVAFFHPLCMHAWLLSSHARMDKTPLVRTEMALPVRHSLTLTDTPGLEPMRAGMNHCPGTVGVPKERGTLIWATPGGLWAAEALRKTTPINIHRIIRTASGVPAAFWRKGEPMSVAALVEVPLYSWVAQRIVLIFWL